MNKGFLKDHVWLKADKSMKSPLQHVWTHKTCNSRYPYKIWRVFSHQKLFTVSVIFLEGPQEIEYFLSLMNILLSNKDNFNTEEIATHANKDALVAFIFYL